MPKFYLLKPIVSLLRSFLIPACLLLSGQGFSQAFIGEYTIGGAGANYATISQAVTALKNGAVAGPVTFKIRNGVYNERVVIPLIPGVTEQRTVTFTAESGNAEDVVISYPATGGVPNNSTVQLVSAKFIILDKLTIRNSAPGSAVGIHLMATLGTAVEFNSVQNCIVRMNGMPGSGGAGILMIAEQFDLAYPAYSNKNTIRNNTIYGGYSGIKLKHYAAQMMGRFNDILYNNIINVYGTGIETEFTEDTRIIGNYISFCLTENIKSVSIGISSFYCFTETIANNVIAGGFSTTDKAYGMRMYIANNTSIYHNSINVDALSTESSAIYMMGGFTNVLIKNNIFCNSSVGYAYYNDKDSTFSSVNQTDNNNYYSKGVYLALLGKKAVKTLAEIRSYSKGDLNSVNDNPDFFSTTDLHTLNPKLDGKAIPGTGIMDDRDLVLRDPVSPDIGAYEFTSPGRDIALESISTLAEPVVGDNEVVVLLRNAGNNSLKDSSISLSYSSDGGVTWSAPETFISTGLTANDDTELFKFAVKWNIPRRNGYYLKARINTPGLASDANKRNDTTGTFLCMELQGSYTIGKPSSDFSTIGAALNMLNCAGVLHNIEFLIEPGVYRERMLISFIPRLSDTAEIVFRSATGKATDVIIIDSVGGAPARHAVVEINGTDLVRLEKLTIENLSRSDISSGILIASNSNNITVSDCIIRLDTTEKDWLNTAGIVYAHYSSFATFGSYALNSHNHRLLRNRISGGSAGIRLYGKYDQHNTGYEVTGNIITEVNKYGIHIEGTDINKLDSNTIIFADYRDPAGCGIYMKTSDDLGSVSGNYIYKSGKYGVYTDQVNGMDITIMANNMIAGGFLNEEFSAGIYCTYTKAIKLIHNSILVDKPGAAFRHELGTNAGLVLQNNILSNTADGYAYYIVNSENIVESDFNNLFSTGPALAFVDGTELNDLSAIQTGTPYESASVAVDPQFIAMGDLHTRSAFLDGKGIYIESVPYDYDGDIRDVLPDIGADEFDPLAPADTLNAGVLYFISPGNTVTAGTSVSVKVTIKNYGNKSISAFPVKYTVNGTLAGDEIVTAILTPGDTVQHVFTVPFAPATPGIYSLKAFTVLPGDLLNENDTAFVSVTVPVISGMPYGSTLHSKVYPNPASNFLYVESVTPGQLKFFNLAGQLVKTLYLDSEKKCIDLQLSPGCYLLQAESKDESVYYKLIVN